MPWKSKPPVIKPPYRSIRFNDERKWKTTHLLDDVLQVGKLKAVGYVTERISFITKEFDLPALSIQLFNDHKLIRITEKGDVRFLWVGDPQMMSDVINKHIDIISNINWPTNSDEFLTKLSREHVEHRDNRDMYHVICDMFNSWCLWCEQPISKKHVDGSMQWYSQHPYDPDKE